MIGEINQHNLYLILPSKISWLADMLTQYKDVNILEAMKLIYSSQLYQRLQTEATKLWHLGPVALYEELEDELKGGSIN